MVTKHRLLTSLALAAWLCLPVVVPGPKLALAGSMGTSNADFLRIPAGARPVGMGGAFTAIADEMERLSDEAQHIRPVLVTSASPLAEPQRETLTERLQSQLSGRVKMRFAVDGSLMAGFSIQTDDMVLDNSIRTDLEHIRRKLMTVSST